MFFLLKDMHADDTTSYIYGENIEFGMKSLEQSANLIFNRFKNNQMKGNEDECHVLISTDKTVKASICITHINNGKCEKLLGIKIDYKLSFENHIGNICKKAGAKLNASTRVAQNMNMKKYLIINAFFRYSLFIFPLHRIGC